MDIFGVINVDKYIIDMLLVTSYLLLLLSVVVLIMFIKHHIKQIEIMEEQVDFYRGWALKAKGFKVEIDGTDIDEEEQ